MNEKEKFKEAKYFYYQISKNKRNKENFLYNLSAFLTVARCIFQYSLEEAKSKNNGQIWYDNYISNDKILKFFKEKRNNNIHISPIKSRREVGLTTGGELKLTGSLSAKLIKANGNIINLGELKSPRNSLSESSTNKGNPLPKVRYKYLFTDWSGNEDVLTLCKIYLKKLDYFIKDGIKKSFITG